MKRPKTDMSKRAEEKAKVFEHSLDYHQAINMWPEDAYKMGYELAEKETIERVVAWLKENAQRYVVNQTESYPDAPFRVAIGGKCWDDLKKAMEEEK